MHEVQDRGAGRTALRDQGAVTGHVDVAVLAVQRMREDCTLTYRQALRQVTAELDEPENEAA